MVSALGVNIQLVFAGAFFLGAALAGLGGVFGGHGRPRPRGGFRVPPQLLIVVIIGGMGASAARPSGRLRWDSCSRTPSSTSSSVEPTTFYAILLTFALLVLVLAVRPLGLFGRPA